MINANGMGMSDGLHQIGTKTFGSNVYKSVREQQIAYTLVHNYGG